MSNKKALRKVRKVLLTTGIPIGVFQWVSIILWITKGYYWLFIIWAVIMIPYAIWITRFYYQKVAYLCPQCHKAFQPKFKEFFWAGHTPNTRKLTCPSCGQKNYCLEIAAEELNEKNNNNNGSDCSREN